MNAIELSYNMFDQHSTNSINHVSNICHTMITKKKKTNQARGQTASSESPRSAACKQVIEPPWSRSRNRKCLDSLFLSRSSSLGGILPREVSLAGDIRESRCAVFKSASLCIGTAASGRHIIKRSRFPRCPQQLAGGDVAIAPLRKERHHRGKLKWCAAGLIFYYQAWAGFSLPGAAAAVVVDDIYTGWIGDFSACASVFLADTSESQGMRWTTCRWWRWEYWFFGVM